MGYFHWCDSKQRGCTHPDTNCLPKVPLLGQAKTTVFTLATMCHIFPSVNQICYYYNKCFQTEPTFCESRQQNLVTELTGVHATQAHEY